MRLIKEDNEEYWLNDDGRSHGESKSWYDDGQIYVHCFYVEDEWHGGYKRWSRDGKLREHRFYNHGKLIRDFSIFPFTSDEERFELALIHDGRWL